MQITVVTLALNGLLMILLPLGLGIFLARRFHIGWRLWWIGAATFVLSQVGHIPFNILLTLLFQRGILPAPPDQWALPFNALVLGLSSGLWEELFRYGAFRWPAKDARTWSKALMLGAGHGGIEAIILGVLALLTFASMWFARGVDLTGLVTPAQQALAQQQIQGYWNMPWYMSLMGALERLFAIIFHLSASVLVLQAFTRRQIRWLWLAVLWHALMNATTVFVLGMWGALAVEGALAILTLVSLAIIFGLRQPDPLPEAGALVPGEPEIEAAELPELAPPPETSETLEQTRFD